MLKRVCFFLLFHFSAFQAISSVQMKCISIGAAGDVTITWNNSGPAATFQAYYIYHSTTPGGFTLIDSVLTYATKSYIDVNANALSSSAYYYVSLKSTGGGMTLSDTIRAIKLNLVNTGSGVAILAWNFTHSPLISTNSPYYKIFRE